MLSFNLNIDLRTADVKMQRRFRANLGGLFLENKGLSTRESTKFLEIFA